ncbi:hypothetical protein SMQE30_14920 [Serratia marcescens]|nr:hypothetical protein SMQE30_14920 [Serratia marcescens]
MNVYEMEGFLRGKCVPRDLLVNESNAAYLVRKLSEIAAVKAERDALAVENQALKSKAAELVHEAFEVYSAYNATINEPDGDFIDTQTLYEMKCIETRATDAALAAIQAQGVEKAAEYTAHESSRAEFINSDVSSAFAGLADDLLKLAAELREAK